MARSASATTRSAPADQSRKRDTRLPRRRSNSAANASPPARGAGNASSGSASRSKVSKPTFSKNIGSTSFTRSTIAPITMAASYGTSPAFNMRWRRCSTMPDTVCTIEVNAPIGMT